MESLSNKKSDNIEQDKANTSSKSIKEAVQENTQIIIHETNKILSEKSEHLTNEVAPAEDKPPFSEEAMEVTELSEISKTGSANQNMNMNMEMEVDQIEILDNINEIQGDKQNLSKNEEINKNVEVSKKQEETGHNTEQYKKEENSKDEKANQVESEIIKYDKKINKKEDQIDKDKDLNKNVENLGKNKENPSSKNLNQDKNTKKNTDNNIQIVDNNAKQPLQSKLLKQTLESVDINMENESEKEVTNETNEEVEKTEFIQISQDKEDSQLENQPEAEDPFGGDNLNIRIDSVESMEVDSATNRSKINEEKDNLKDADNLKLKENVSHSNKIETEANKEVEKVQEKPIELLTYRPKETSDKSSERKDERSSAEVLPGQDDEICIIPDSTKVNKSNEKDKVTTIQNANKDKKIMIEGEIHNMGNILKDSKKNNETLIVKLTGKSNEDATLKVSALTTGLNDIQVSLNKSVEGPCIVTSDIIEVDDDNKNPEIEEISSKEVCKQCKEEKTCMIKVKVGTKNYNVCSEVCKTTFITDNNKATDIPSEGVNSKRDKRCANCLLIVEAKDEKNLSWETMEFCNEECLGKFQTRYGSYCRNCNGAVQAVSLGKYCVRFGYDVRQFCCSTCLEEFKKGLKVCSYCQKDISAGTEGFLAPVGDKGQFKDFCTQDCMEKYSKMNSSEPPVPEKKVCGVCQEEKVIYCEVHIDRNPSVPICSEPCFAAFKFVNKVDPDQCSTCKKYFQLPTKKGFVVFYEDEAHTFCNKTCLNVFIITNRKIVPCNWCKVKKYNFDMIKKELKTGQVMMMCSLNCLTLYQVSINAVSARRINCDFCKEYSQAQYHLTMSDATIRNFCSYKCVMNFQAQYTKSPITIPTSDTSTDPVPTGIPKRAVGPSSSGTSIASAATSATVAAQLPRPIQPAPPPDIAPKKTLPVISSVTSLAAIANGQTQNSVQQAIGAPLQPITLQGAHPVIYKQQVVTRPTSPVDVGNKMTQCKPQMHTKGVSVRPIPCSQSTQTDGVDRLVLPIPVPLYVPFPVHMYSMPFPVPVPIPIPIPVPIFIPTTRNSAKGIFKEIKRIQEKIPSDPFEAELLMMAEMVATEKKNESDSDSNDEARDDGDVNDGPHTDTYSPEGVDSSNAFGDDMLQMALKMATGELDESAVDLETALTPNTIQTPQRSQNDESADNDVQPERIHAPRGRKRGTSYKTRSIPSKRGRRTSGANDITTLPSPDSQPSSQSRFMEPIEKPDANMALKYTFGVNAWRQWVITKNAELEKQSTSTRKLKLFKTDLLQLTADELNYSLCLFVKEVRKPNGAEYAPDTIYYLCLGIQQYLFENSRIDNIFTDAYYEKFTDCLNEVAKKFTSLYNDALYVVTRVEEEHLWECKQLGAHSPHVLLNTLMYFTTKHFNLVSVEEHMQLSFSHIMKHWKRNPAAQPGAVAGKIPGSRNVLLRFYPPQSTLEANSKKKKVYEQQENEDNPLRCPVKLYEFYLSKCPESVKTRNDVFYLLPERSCVPDSPVWYSTSPLAKENLIKMLYRIKMVKEINVALLAC